MKKLKLPQGTDNFRKAVETSDFFFDKSLFINDVLENIREAQVIIRPRRWGKTMNLDMLKTFLAIEVDENGNPFAVNPHRALFEGGIITTADGDTKELSRLEIGKINNGSFIEKHQGQHPVILLSLKDVVGTSYEIIEQKLRSKVSSLFSKHEYLYKSLDAKTYKTPSDKHNLQKWLSLVEESSSNATLAESVGFLSELLYKFHGKKVFILIDEYDRPVNYLLAHPDILADDNVISKTSTLISSVLSNCGKSYGDYLDRMILTGIHDAVMKDLGSGFNSIEVYKISGHKYSTHFGFSEEEVFALIDRIDFGENTEIVKQNIKNWYNGYSVPVGKSEGIYQQTYNPRAVVSYLTDAMDGRFSPGNYWAASGTQDILFNLFKKVKDLKVYDKFFSLLEGNEEELEFDRATTFEKQINPFKDLVDITRILLEAGYLTGRIVDKKFLFRIPNKEVQSEFRKVATQQLKDLGYGAIKDQDSIDKLQEVLEEHDKKLKLEALKKTTLNLILEGTPTEVRRAFEDKILKNCELKDSSLSLFHLAAIRGNEMVLKVLIDNCDSSLINSMDSNFGLKPINYAKLSGDSSSIKILESYDNNSLLKAPNIFKSTVCLLPDDPYILAGFTAMTYLVISGVRLCTSVSFKAEKEITLKAYGATVASTTTLIWSKDILKFLIGRKWCDDYDNYHDIDITKLGQIKTPIQFEKYLLEHEKAYVRINEECSEIDTKIASMDMPIYETKDSGALVLNLCDYEVTKIEL